MSGLPEGWEWDYDGRRWFYKYKPNGHIQYHFPKEGDEFPDFVDIHSPIPDLEPEERLESQQQVRRHTSDDPKTKRGLGSDGGPNSTGGWRSRMSATARPVSAVYEDCGDEETNNNTVFQPENFMYLGPGTYNDVSPLAEEEEEATRRVVAGGIKDRADKSPGKGVSPLASERTTPLRGPHAQADPVMGETIVVPPTVPEEPCEPIPMIDSREVPQPFDPVGIMAEMPTQDMAPARIEIYPDLVEMADNMVLAPIETAIPEVAELPERTSPIEKKKGPQLAPGSLRDHGPQQQPMRIEITAIDEASVAGFHAYKPHLVPVQAQQTPTSTREKDSRERRTTLQRETSLLISVKPAEPPTIDHSNIPAALAPPQVPPKRPLDDNKTPVMPLGKESSGPSQDSQQGTLSYMPSVLKASRDAQWRNSLQAGQPAPIPQRDDWKASPILEQQGDLAHMPSVLKPARGKTSSQPGLPSSNSSIPLQGHGYVPPAHGQHPPSMTPAPLAQHKRLQQEEPRIGIQRVNTVPDVLPSQVSTALGQGVHQTFEGPRGGVDMTKQPVRPASVMPNMTGAGQEQQRMPIQQGYGQSQQKMMNMPYHGRIQGMPTTAPPPSGQPAPFPAPGEKPQIQAGPAPPNVSQISSQQVEPLPPMVGTRRHSSFGPSGVSPIDSRRSSSSSMFPLQTPSPMEHSRRTSSSSASIGQVINRAGYTPSPVSQSSASNQGFTPTPPSAPSLNNQGSYFSMQDIEGKGHAVAAQNTLRRKSSSRGSGPDTGKRGSVGSEQMAAQRGSPLSSPPATKSYDAAPRGLSRSQSLHQTSEGTVIAQQQPPQPQGQGQPYLGRIEEHEEVPTRNVSRTPTTGGTPERTRRSSLASSLQHSPQSSRRSSLTAESPRAANQAQFTHQGQPAQTQRTAQSQQQPQDSGYLGQGHVPTTVNAPSPGQAAPHTPTLLKKKQPIKGQPPAQSPVAPLGHMPQGQALPGQIPHNRTHQGQLLPPGQAPQMMQHSHVSHPGQPAQAHQGQQFQMHPQAPTPNPNGRTQPQVKIPQGQQPWHPNLQSSATQGQSAGLRDGKDSKKWFKWFKGGSKSVSHSPTTPQSASPMTASSTSSARWGGGEYAQAAVWQPDQPLQGQAIQGQLAQGQPQGQPQGQLQEQPLQGLPRHEQPLQGQPPYRQLAQGQPQGLPQGQSQEQPKAQSLQGQPLQGQLIQGQPQAQSLERLPHHEQSLQGQAPQRQLAQEQNFPGQAPRQQYIQGPPQSGFQLNVMADSSHHSGQLTPVPSQMHSEMIHSQTEPQTSPLATSQTQRAPGNSHMPYSMTHTKVDSRASMAPPLKLESVTSTSIRTHPSVQAESGSMPLPQGVSPTEPATQSFQMPPVLPAKASAAPIIASRANEEGHVRPETNRQPPALEPLALNSNSGCQDATSPQPSPAFSDAGLSTTSRISSQKRDSLSDTGSITTIEVSEARTQPVLRPQVIQVQRRSQDFSQKSQDAKPPPGSQTNVKPAKLSDAYSYNMESDATHGVSPAKHVEAQPPVFQPISSRRPDTQESSFTPAPLFSSPKSPATTSNGVSKQQSYPPQASQITYQEPDKKQTPALEDKWAKKPVVDYSGGDWGDDDDWSY